MEDTGWPHAPLDDYIKGLEELYYPMIRNASTGIVCWNSRRCSRSRTALISGAR